MPSKKLPSSTRRATQFQADRKVPNSSRSPNSSTCHNGSKRQTVLVAKRSRLEGCTLLAKSFYTVQLEEKMLARFAVLLRSNFLKGFSYISRVDMKNAQLRTCMYT
ncbi:MAG: hypothetical protein GY820_30570 [Gammaproteobacteria bacterium]|nr:hypothetical protein [Gammaproteobacteria bacterium]